MSFTNKSIIADILALPDAPLIVNSVNDAVSSYQLSVSSYQVKISDLKIRL